MTSESGVRVGPAKPTSGVESSLNGVGADGTSSRAKKRTALIITIYAFSVTAILVLIAIAQVAMTGLARSMPWLLTIVWSLVMLCGLATLPIWFLRRRWVYPLLIVWWLPQVLSISLSSYSGDGGALIQPVWHLPMLFNLSPNLGLPIGESTYLQLHANLVAITALVLLYWSRAAFRDPMPGTDTGRQASESP